MKKGDVYRGFRVLSAEKIEDFGATAIYLRHEKSGLEVYHLLNSDEENLFAFCFRTPSQDSTGAAHVLEHSVLCGSEKYPLRDPFIQLAKQSVNTYLNAFTASDRTVFPSSSLIRADYWNLMSVYADAVFFPLLREEVFSQECWHLENDEEGNPAISGVVYNEMKGNYSSFISVAGDAVKNAIVPNTNYEYDSGGDPAVIPELTHSRLKAFHRKYYCTSNCLVFLYGNIPTEEQLDFLDENVISRVRDYGKKFEFPRKKIDPVVKFQKALAPCENDSTEEENKSTISLSWRIGQPVDMCDKGCTDGFELMFLGDLIYGGDSAPLSRALLKKFPESGLSYLSGTNTTTRHLSVTFALKDFDPARTEEFEQTVDATMERLAQEGFESDDLERAFNDFEFSNREVKRNVTGGPFSIVLLQRVLRSWTYGGDPALFLSFRKLSEGFRGKIEKNPDYLKELVRKWFLENRERSLVQVTPSAEYTESRTRAEKELAARLYDRMGKAKVEKTLEKMAAFQNSPEWDRSDLIPSIGVRDLEPAVERIRTSLRDCAGVPLYENVENAGGIVYASVLFPVDTLKPEDYVWLPILEACLPDCGWKGVSWDKAASLIDRFTGNFSVFTRVEKVSADYEEYARENPLIVGREWLTVHFKYLEEYGDQVFDMACQMLSKVDFSDLERIKTLVTGLRSSIENKLVPYALRYAGVRSRRKLGRYNAVMELVDGLSSVANIGRISRMDPGEIAENLRRIYRKIFSSGAVFHVTADRKGCGKARIQFEKFARELKLKSPVARRNSRLSDFIRLTELEGTCGAGKVCASGAVDEVFLIPGDIGFVASCVESCRGINRQAIADYVFCHLHENSRLWHKIRTQGGAYGVYMSESMGAGLTMFMTYRDPKPFDSSRYFDEDAGFGEELEFYSEEEVEKAVCGVFAGEIEPMTPGQRGGTGFMRVLYGGSDGDQRKMQRLMLSIKTGDIKKAMARYAQRKKLGETVVLCGKSLVTSEIKKNCGKIIKLGI